MPDFSLDREMEVVIEARFIAKGTDLPVSGEQYILRMYDSDVFGEDCLGQTGLDAKGVGRVTFSHTAFEHPLKNDAISDFYFVLYKDKIPVFQSRIIEQLTPETLMSYEPGTGDVIDLGSFLVDVSE